MRARALAVSICLLVAAAVVGCSGNMSSNLTPPGQIPVSVSMRDTPPAGVTILAFEIHVTGATLQPADSSQPAVPLVPRDTEIELRHLETESALLSTAGVAAGTYNSLNLTFANPEMTIQNSSTQAITVAGKTCAAGAICEVEPPLNPVSVQVSSAPFPLTLTAHSGLSLDIDFDVNASVQNDLSIQPTVSVTPTMTQAREEMEDIDELVGQVTNIGTNQFTLTTFNGQSDVIQVDASTQFEDFDDAGCAADNFTCVQSGQIVSVHLSVMDDDDDDSGSMTTTSSAGLVAKKVELKDHFEKEAEGLVVGVNAASSQFQLVIRGEATPLQAMGLGNVITVTVNTGATFDVDQDGLTIPSGLQFQSISDLTIGQSVELNPVSVSASPSGISVTTDHVRLHRTVFTATIGSISGANLTLTNLPNLLSSAGITQIQVQTSSQTQFDGVAGVSGLAAGDTISVSGLLFNSSPNAVLLAEKIRKR